MTKSLISIIVPVYKVEKYLSRCVDSLINQTYKDLEIILVDDGSPDNSPKICDEYAEKDKRIKVIHKENGGVSSARNAGLKNATGEFVYFCDSDDYIEKDMLEKMINSISSCDWVMCGYNIVCDKQIKKHTYKSFSNNLSDFLINTIHSWDFGLLWNKLYRRDLIDLEFDESYLVREDLLFNTMYFSKVKSIGIVNEPLYNYIKRQGSLTSSKKKVDFNQLKETHFLMNKCLHDKNLEEVVEHQNAVFLKSLINIFKMYSGVKITKEIKGEINNILDDELVSSALKDYKAEGIYEKIFIRSIQKRRIGLIMFLVNLRYK